jgi:MATE family multidrug resistance protein
MSIWRSPVVAPGRALGNVGTVTQRRTSHTNMLAPPSRAALLRFEAQATLHLALPLIGGQLAAFSWSIVDIVLAGHLGAAVLGAVAVGTNVVGFAIMAIMGVLMALPPSVAQLDGAGRRGEVASLFRQAVYLAVGLGFALGLLTLWFGTGVARVAGVDAALLPGVDAFLRGVWLAVPGFGLFCACRGLADGTGMTRLTLLFSVLGLALLAPLAWVLMYGKFGLPALGPMGSGIATAIALWAEGLVYLVYLRLSPRTRDFGWAHGRRGPDFALIALLLKLGVPMAVSVLLEVGMFNTAALLIARFGDAAVASHQIALNVAAVSLMVPLGLAMAVTVRVGHAVGRGDPEGMRRAGFVGIGMALAFETITSTLMLVLPGPIIALYTSDPAVMAGAVTLLFYAALFQFSDGTQVAAAGALRGFKDTRVPMLITALAYWGVGMPGGWVLAFPAGLGPRGMWIGMILGLTVAAVLLTTRFWRASRPKAAGVVAA